MTFKNKTLLLVVGAARSGTSWYYHYCKDHPQIGVSPIKDIHYFDQLYGDRKAFKKIWKTDWRKAERKLERMKARGKSKPTLIQEQFEVADVLRRRLELLNGDPATNNKYYEFIEHYTKNHNVFADITPAYALLTAHQFKEIKSTHEKIKVIFLMRDPVNRFYSQIRLGEKTSKSNKNVQNIKAIKNFEKILKRPERTARGDYKNIITQLETVFDPNELHYVFYENLFSDDGIKGICEFLDVDFRPGKYSDNINFAENQKPIPPKLAKLARLHFADIYDFCRHKFNDVPESWMK